MLVCGAILLFLRQFCLFVCKKKYKFAKNTTNAKQKIEMKKSFCLVILSVIALCMWAAPTMRVRKTIRLANGEKVEVTMRGDEDFTYMITADGRVAELMEEGYVLRPFEQSETQRKARLASIRAPRRSNAVQAQAPLRSIGSPTIAVVLAEFYDVKFSEEVSGTNPEETFQKFFQGNGNDDPARFTELGSYGAVRDYFRDQSQGLFTPNFKVVGTVTVPSIHHAYPNNRAGFRDEALTKATQLEGVNWNDYDSDGDGKVDAVIIVFPGLGHNQNGDANDMHACCWGGAVTKNGVTFATQLIGPEQRLKSSGPVINGIGVFCHEMSHMLGLPDFYDTTSPADAPGMDIWDIMDYGEYTGAGTRPTGYTAYEKEYMGWITIPELEGAQHLEMTSLAEGGQAYRICNKANRDEYYILEVRNKNYKADGYYNWDETMCNTYTGQGLLVTHVDFTPSLWNSNSPNSDKNHQRMIIVPANNHFQLLDELNTEDRTGNLWRNELHGHTYPCKNIDAGWGVLGNNELSDTSEPAATLFNENEDGEKLLHISLTNIEQDEQDHITLDFTPNGETAIGTVEAVFAPWQTDCYTLDGRRAASGEKGIVVVGGKLKVRN